MALLQASDKSGVAPVKPLSILCHTCKLRKDCIFTVDPNGKPQCADCAYERGHNIDGR